MNWKVSNISKNDVKCFFLFTKENEKPTGVHNNNTFTKIIMYEDAKVWFQKQKNDDLQKG